VSLAVFVLKSKGNGTSNESENSNQRMSNLSVTYYSKIYKEFKAIEGNEYLSIVRFYESYKDNISHLNFSEYFELLISYTNALFEIGAYQSHVKVVDTAIQISISNNIKFYNGRDIYAELLFKKAASCYNLMEYDQTEHILRELIKISPYNEMAHLFLKKCLLRKKTVYLSNLRGIAILLLLATALIIAVELIFIRTLFTAYSSIFEIIRNTTFVCSLLLIIGSAILHRVQIYFWVKQFVSECKMRKG
jgi:tetratricopeptide (TPR) repeat protein